MNYDLIDQAVQETVALFTGRPCGMVKPPSDTPELPYTILYPIQDYYSEDGITFGDVDHGYQVKCVGSSVEMVGWIRGQICDLIPNLVIEGTGFRSSWGLRTGGGAIIPSGDKLYECNDDFEVRIEHAEAE